MPLPKGYRHTEEVKRKMRERAIKRHIEDKEFGFQKGHKFSRKAGFKHSKKTKRKMSIARKGIIFSEEHIKNIGLASKGRKHTEKSKRKISKSLKKMYKNGRIHWCKGKKHPQNGIPRKPEGTSQRGYIYIFSPNHPFKNNRNYVRRSRLVMEKKIGRYLTPEETVHHINGIVNDDRPKNLMLFPNKGEHTKFHNKSRFEN